MSGGGARSPHASCDYVVWPLLVCFPHGGATTPSCIPCYGHSCPQPTRTNARLRPHPHHAPLPPAELPQCAGHAAICAADKTSFLCGGAAVKMAAQGAPRAAHAAPAALALPHLPAWLRRRGAACLAATPGHATGIHLNSAQLTACSFPSVPGRRQAGGSAGACSDACNGGYGPLKPLWRGHGSLQPLWGRDAGRGARRPCSRRRPGARTCRASYLGRDRTWCCCGPRCCCGTSGGSVSYHSRRPGRHCYCPRAGCALCDGHRRDGVGGCHRKRRAGWPQDALNGAAVALLGSLPRAAAPCLAAPTHQVNPTN